MNDCIPVAPSLLYRLKMRIRRLFAKKQPSPYRLHAERELKALGYRLNETEEGPNKWVVENIMELLKVFAAQGHSGSSAPYVANLFVKLALFEPTCPLKGTDDEWNQVGPHVWQNNRCSHVFKKADGKAYDIEGKIFREPNGSCYQSRASRVDVTFPYTPKREYVDVDYNGNPIIK